MNQGTNSSITPTQANETTDDKGDLLNRGWLDIINIIIGCTCFLAGLTIGISLTVLARTCCKKKTKDYNKVVCRVENEQIISDNGVNVTKGQKSSHVRSKVSTKTRKADTLDNRRNAPGQLRRTNSEQYELARPLNSSTSEQTDMIYKNSGNPQNTRAQKYGGETRKKKKQTDTFTRKNSLTDRKEQTRIKRTNSSDYVFARSDRNISAGEPMVRFTDDVVKFETENTLEEERLRRKYSTDYEFACPSDSSFAGKSGNSAVALTNKINPISNMYNGSIRGHDTRRNDQHTVETKLQRTDYEMARPTGSDLTHVANHDAMFKQSEYELVKPVKNNA